MRYSFAVLVLWAVALLPHEAAQLPRAPASFRGKIVFFGSAHRERAASLIQTMNPDGTGLEAVLELQDTSIHSGRVSPDGRYVAYTTRCKAENDAQVRRLSFDGNEEVLAEGGSVAAVVAWSPDGKRLACYRRKGANWESFTVDVDTKQVRLLPVPHTDVVEDWSPDGKVLTVMAGNKEKVFDHPEKGTYPLRQIYFMTIDGADVRPLTAGPHLDCIWSRFSPDGRHVAHYRRSYATGEPLESAVVVNRSGEDANEVVRFRELDDKLKIRPLGAPCWSPDGKHVVWRVTVRATPDGPYEWELVFAASDGAENRRLHLTKDDIQFWGAIDWR